MIGDDFFIISGFTGEWTNVTKKVFGYNTKAIGAAWRPMDDVPVPGFTHAAIAVDGLVMYLCGAYVGGTPGPDSKICMKFTPYAPSGLQWSFLPDMPDGRGGGGLNHIKETNSIIYATGATRRNGVTTDFNTTWELFLDNLAAGWIRRADIPYKGNHASHVTAFHQGRPRYYWAGGQLEQQEWTGNQNDLVEWDQPTQTWIRRANMTLARGHASSSTIAYGCGFLMIGGAINTGTKTPDVAFYGIYNDQWTSIGNLTKKMNTPVCDIVRGVNGSDWVYCQSGPINNTFNIRRQITI
jgi:hypothetical protein